MRHLVSVAIGLAIGLVIALFIGYDVAPVQVTDGTVADLSRSYKDEYTVMVAAAYQVDCDVSAAFDRLKSLKVTNTPAYVFDTAQRFVSESGTGKESDVRNLIILSRAMNGKDKDTQLMRALVPQDVPCIPASQP
jgi:hypothetical protein